MVISQAQLADRNKGIGSSDAAAILGLSSFKTPYDVWLVKTGRAEGTVTSDAAWIGSMLEGAVLKMAQEKIGRPIVAAPDDSSATFVSGCLRANVDGMVDEFRSGNPIVEVKTTGRLQDWGDPYTDGVPDHVLIQVTHQMICAKSEVCHVARLGAAFGFSFDIFTVPLDKSFADEVETKLNEWWTNHVVRDTPPEITDGAAPSYDLLRERKRNLGEIVELPDELVRNERECKKVLEAAEKAHASAKAALIAALGDAAMGVGGGVKVTVSEMRRAGFDMDRFKIDHPEIAKQYMKTSAYPRIDIRDIGKVIRA